VSSDHWNDTLGLKLEKTDVGGRSSSSATVPSPFTSASSGQLALTDRLGSDHQDRLNIELTPLE
jgi:hypothetical protein